MKNIPIYFNQNNALPDVIQQNQYINKIYQNFSNVQTQVSIESGYFILTMMPSLKCDLNCPHCYLSKEQRRSDEILSIHHLSLILKKIDDYYEKRNINQKIILVYWYGGEPTEMGFDYFEQAIELINSIFNQNKKYIVKHTILTSLIGVNHRWFDFFKKYCDGHFQTSFDGLMRGKGYLKKWQEKVIEAKSFGLSIGTISVVNHELLKLGAKDTLDYLSKLGIEEASFLPFMLNEQNSEKAYDKFAPTMNSWSQFMIEISKDYFYKKQNNQPVPEIGQLAFILSQKNKTGLANIAGQTLFLLPNGDFVLPDYKDGYKEYMRVFGNGIELSFDEVLKSSERKSYIRKQLLKNNNDDCQQCENSHYCVMEFWKENKKNDDCFGGKLYIEWLESFSYQNKDNPMIQKIIEQQKRSIIY